MSPVGSGSRRTGAAVGLALAAAMGSGSAATAQERAAPVFQDGQAQVVPAFSDTSTWIRQELWVETEFDTDGDGNPDRVHVDVTRPAQTDSEELRVPVVYETSPYYAGLGSGSQEYFWNVRQDLGEPSPPRNAMPAIQARTGSIISNSLVGTWVPRGFAVVHSESPGTGLSQGCPTIGGANESLAPKAVVDWLNGRARGFTEPVGGEEVTAYWSTGRVGMTGTSYNGTLPIAAATTGVDGLEAIVPIAPNTSYYHYYRSNGLVRSPGGYLGEDVDVLFDFINSGDPDRREYCVRTYRDGELASGQDRISGDYSDFWAGRDYLNQMDEVEAATLIAHGFNDWNVMPAHSVRVFEALSERGVPVQAYFHQGGHGGAPPLRMMNRWFSRYLYGIENGVENDPPVWIVRRGDRTTDPTPYAGYPNPDASDVTLFPTRGGVSAGGLLTDAPGGQGTETLTDDVRYDGASLILADSSSHRLVYLSEALGEPLHISGTPHVELRLSASAPAANLSVWLISVPADRAVGGSVFLITRGWADPQNHASIRDGAPLQPGRLYDVGFDLQPDDQVLDAGTRIALMVFSSDPEFTLWPPPGRELTLDLDGSRLTLPVVGGRPAYDAAVSR